MTMGFRGLLRSEWGKLWSVTATPVGVGVSGLLALGVAGLLLVKREAGELHSYGSIIARCGPAWGLALVPVMVIAALAITSEYSTRSIQSTLLAAPDRPRLLAAKGTVVAAMAWLTGQVVGVSSFVLAAVPYNHGGSVASREVIVPVLVMPLVWAVIAVFSLAVGALLRSTAATITVLLVEKFALVAFLELLFGERGEWIFGYLPSWIGNRLATTTGFTSGAWTAAAILATWTIVAWGCATWLSQRRDA